MHLSLRVASGWRRFAALTAALGLLAACALGPRAWAASPIPVADFFKPADFSELKVSPSGKRLSAIIPGANGRKQLAVFGLQDLTDWKVVASYQAFDIGAVDWVDDDRLVYSVFDQQSGLGHQTAGAGLFVLDAVRGTAPRTLIRPRYSVGETIGRITDRTLDPSHVLVSVLRDGTSDLIVSHTEYDNRGEPQRVALLRLDTRNGNSHSVSVGAPGDIGQWTTDAAGRPRTAQSMQGDKEVLYWKSTPDAAWLKVAESSLFGGKEILPVYVDPEDRLYAAVTGDDPAGTSMLVKIDMHGGGIEAATPVFAAKGFDFQGDLVRNAAGQVLGIHYLTDARASYWFDAGMKKIQEQVDALLPDTNNTLDCGTCDVRTRVLVTSTSDRQPGAYRVFDPATGKLAPFGTARPWIKPTQMGQRDMVRIAARDGLSLPVYVTKPVGRNGPAPMVVLVHGGPWLRGGEWAWDAQAQFLASRGYVVLQPEYRGSTGFGYRHFKAGWKQWGLAMQDDLADATRWAVAQHIADPQRICIAGSSYGGYATLMGLIRDPQLYRCGIDSFGVTDIDLMYSIQWSDASDRWQKYGMPLLIGDRQKDAAQLAATSPIRLAAQVTQPVLMAYGGIDRRVPIEQGTAFYDAVRRTDPKVDWVVYRDEGHGFVLPANAIDFWSRVDRFLAAQLQGAP